MKEKILEWIKRYLPAEVGATIGAISGAIITNLLFKNDYLSAFAGTWGENLFYYSLILYQDLQKRKERDEKITLIGFWKVIRNMLFEFSLGEIIDSFLIRPTAMYFFPKIIGNFVIGIFIGKIVADVIFYIPTIIFYELKKIIFKD